MMKEIYLLRQEDEEEVSFRKAIEPMTRAEWVKKAREECEKELPYYEEEPKQVDFCRYVDLSGNDDREMEDIAGEERVEEQEEWNSPLKAMEEENSWAEQPIYKPEFTMTYVSKLIIRLVVAASLALLLIGIDHFKVKINGVDPEIIRNTITKNDNIESLEDAVTTFAKDKVLPIFQKD